MYGNKLGEAIACQRKLGVIIFREPNEIEYCSAAAQAQLEQSNIWLNESRLCAESIDNSEKILCAVKRCFRSKSHRETCVVLGELPVSAVVISLFFSDRVADGDGVVVALVRSPATNEWEADGPRIMNAFGLTTREAQLGLHLSRGQDLSEFAEKHFLTINTVKTHLKQLFKKMGVKKQIQVAVAVWATLR